MRGARQKIGAADSRALPVPALEIECMVGEGDRVIYKVRQGCGGGVSCGSAVARDKKGRGGKVSCGGEGASCRGWWCIGPSVVENEWGFFLSTGREER
jgi:hypothetical protein